MKRAELARGPGPRRKAEMPRTAWTPRPVPAASAAVLALPPLSVAGRAPARYTGPSALVRHVCWARLDGLCAGCGRPCPAGTWRSLQHRAARMAGGRAGPAANAFENLIGLCGSATSPGCHLRCEQRDPVMHQRGLWLRSWQDPAREPVGLWDGRVAWLGADGGLLDHCPTDPTEPEGACAA